MKLSIVLLTCLVLAPGGPSYQTSQSPASAAGPLPPSVERAYLAVAGRFNRDDAMEVVAFMDRYWRIAGNPGFNASIDHIRDRLIAAGFTAGAGRAPATVRVDEFPNASRGWDYRVGTLAFDAGDEPPILSRERDRVSLAINSFPTPPSREGIRASFGEAGLRAPLVDVGAGEADSDYAAKAIKGSVVLGDAPLDRLWQEAVNKRGAAGVVSTAVARYIRPADPLAMSDEQRDVLQWGSVPYDAGVRGFGFKASWRAADRMRRKLKEGSVTVRVEIDSSFYDGPNRSLVAEIAGRSRPAERIVMVAHVQEPGANDDASGCATLYGLARALVEAIRTGALPQPERTLTFMWVDEIRGSRQWIASRATEARGVQYMFALDMTGEDTSKTGGTFLIEKQADPSAVWPRPSDPHSDWGAGQVDAGALRGSLLNDLHLAVCLRRARDAQWVVRTNPYEGGSDHTPFAEAGVPSLLNWHFTDRYYHTNQDTADKTSAAEMENVGVAVATSAWFLASADARDAEAVAGLLETAAARRLALEREQGRLIVERATNKPDAEATEKKVMAAWMKWYEEALDSVLRLPPDGPTDELRERIARAKRATRSAGL
jgi:aminopeptidase YwaD